MHCVYPLNVVTHAMAPYASGGGGSRRSVVLYLNSATAGPLPPSQPPSL